MFNWKAFSVICLPLGEYCRSAWPAHWCGIFTSGGNSWSSRRWARRCGWLQRFTCNDLWILLCWTPASSTGASFTDGSLRFGLSVAWSDFQVWVLYLFMFCSSSTGCWWVCLRDYSCWGSWLSASASWGWFGGSVLGRSCWSSVTCNSSTWDVFFLAIFITWGPTM